MSAVDDEEYQREVPISFDDRGKPLKKSLNILSNHPDYECAMLYGTNDFSKPNWAAFIAFTVESLVRMVPNIPSVQPNSSINANDNANRMFGNKHGSKLNNHLKTNFSRYLCKFNIISFSCFHFFNYIYKIDENIRCQ